MRSWKKRPAVRNLVFDHLSCVRTALHAFEQATRAYFVNEDYEKANEFAFESIVLRAMQTTSGVPWRRP